MPRESSCQSVQAGLPMSPVRQPRSGRWPVGTHTPSDSSPRPEEGQKGQSLQYRAPGKSGIKKHEVGSKGPDIASPPRSPLAADLEQAPQPPQAFCSLAEEESFQKNGSRVQLASPIPPSFCKQECGAGPRSPRRLQLMPAVPCFGARQRSSLGRRSQRATNLTGPQPAASQKPTFLSGHKVAVWETHCMEGRGGAQETHPRCSTKMPQLPKPAGESAVAPPRAKDPGKQTERSRTLGPSSPWPPPGRSPPSPGPFSYLQKGTETAYLGNVLKVNSIKLHLLY